MRSTVGGCSTSRPGTRRHICNPLRSTIVTQPLRLSLGVASFVIALQHVKGWRQQTGLRATGTWSRRQDVGQRRNQECTHPAQRGSHVPLVIILPGASVSPAQTFPSACCASSGASAGQIFFLVFSSYVSPLLPARLAWRMSVGVCRSGYRQDLFSGSRRCPWFLLVSRCSLPHTRWYSTSVDGALLGVLVESEMLERFNLRNGCRALFGFFCVSCVGTKLSRSDRRAAGHSFPVSPESDSPDLESGSSDVPGSGRNWRATGGLCPCAYLCRWRFPALGLALF